MIPEHRKNSTMKTATEYLSNEGLDRIQAIAAEDIDLTVDQALELDIEAAIQERDILLLRSQLKTITPPMTQSTGETAPDYTPAYFGLSEEVFNPINLEADDQELALGNYLQKLHIKNHTVSSREIIHDLYTEEQDLRETETYDLSTDDEFLFSEIAEAVTEKEITDLRANLQSIGQSVSGHEHSLEELDDFVNGDLDQELARMIMEEARDNKALSDEILLHTELGMATGEKDVMRLRTGLQAMMSNEYSHSRGIEEIDQYLSEELSGTALADFEEELMLNSGLASDLHFHRELDKASAESEVMNLRSQLRTISSQEQGRTSELLGLSPRRKSLFWYAAASSIVLMIVFSSLLRHKTYTAQQLYTTYYQPYRSGASVSRSALQSEGLLVNAVREIEKGDYNGALSTLGESGNAGDDGFSRSFYRGVAYQELGQYESAIQSFSSVVQHGDNLLVEQSEWYIGLCYLRLEDREQALAQFRRIVSGNGYYKSQSDKLLKQLK